MTLRRPPFWALLLLSSACSSSSPNSGGESGQVNSGTGAAGGSTGQAGSEGVAGSAGSSGSSGVGAGSGTGASSNGGGGGTAGAGGDPCNLPLVSGNCLAAFRRWGFNPQSGLCEAFIYGGCDGNTNNYPSAQECVQQCAESHPSPCDIITCHGPAYGDAQCVYVAGEPECLEPCAENSDCPGALTCGCGASCPGCRDCVQSCLP